MVLGGLRRCEVLGVLLTDGGMTGSVELCADARIGARVPRVTDMHDSVTPIRSPAELRL